MDLGIIIKNIRKQKGIKQNAFAEQCDLSQTYLSQIENNQKEPNISTLKKISSKLEIPLPILFFLAIDENDIPESKKLVFTTISPIVKILIKELIGNA